MLKSKQNLGIDYVSISELYKQKRSDSVKNKSIEMPTTKWKLE